jgi:hypothetical protein
MKFLFLVITLISACVIIAAVAITPVQRAEGFSLPATAGVEGADGWWLVQSSDNGGVLKTPFQASVNDNSPDGVKWKLTGADSTIYKKMPVASVGIGQKLVLSMLWRSVLKPGSNAGDCPLANLKGIQTGREITGTTAHVRCIAMTGDFRLGLFDTGGSFDQSQLSVWKAFQVRFHPHLMKVFERHAGANDSSNASAWMRMRSSPAEGLLDDWCQHGGDGRQQCGFAGGKLKSKIKTGAEAPISPGWYVVRVELVRSGDKVFKPSLTLHNSKYQVDEANYADSKLGMPINVDAIAIAFTNRRPYKEIHIKDVKLEVLDATDSSVRPDAGSSADGVGAKFVGSD